MIRVFEAPSDRADSTNSFSRSDSTWPRTVRAMYVQLMIAITMITTGRPGWIRPPMQPSAPEQQDREREHDVDEPREDRVGPAAIEAGDQADDGADQHGEAGRDERDL